ncbi:MAG: hypothetical protein B0D92_05480 [Spirochaeta sp. LUC14_002_19_P3]|nr:MAG: hypothetical protein B0D92_05480 [Spirochaeta sp. LUC14_002_19_P3]
MIDKEIQESKVAAYYNSSTPRFLRTKQKKLAGAIHRRLIPPPEAVETDPSHYSESLILDIIRGCGARRVLDLGCGVGGTIRYLKSHYQADYTGISLSRVQCEIAESLDTPVELGSYLDPRWYENREPFGVVYALESLQHCPDHSQLARNLKQIMKPGALLVVVDDFISYEPLNRRQTRLLKRFRKHWHSPGCISETDFIEIYSRGGLTPVQNIHLTPLMAKPLLNRYLRALGLNLLSLYPARNSVMDNIIGGGTLRLLQQMGVMKYSLLVFRAEPNV